MLLKDVKQLGFYEAQPFKEQYHEIYEIFEDKEIGLCLDVWIFDYIAQDGRKVYQTDGCLLTPESEGYANLNVTATKEKWVIPKLELNAGSFLVEDKLTYKEKLEKIAKLCDKESTKSTFNNGIENKDAQKLAVKILKIIQ